MSITQTNILIHILYNYIIHVHVSYIILQYLSSWFNVYMYLILSYSIYLPGLMSTCTRISYYLTVFIFLVKCLHVHVSHIILQYLSSWFNVYMYKNVSYIILQYLSSWFNVYMYTYLILSCNIYLPLSSWFNVYMYILCTCILYYLTVFIFLV